MTKRAVTNQRKTKAIIEENTRLKRTVRDLNICIETWLKWHRPILGAILKGDKLRALALFEGTEIKGDRPHGEK